MYIHHTHEIYTLEQFEAALALAEEAHKGQRYSFGGPYIVHPLKLMLEVLHETDDIYLAMLAVLHDTAEDTWVTLDLLAEKFGQELRDDIDALTYREGEDYVGVYIPRLCLRPNAAVIKLRDLRYNKRMLITHPLPEPRHSKLANRYAAATPIVEAAVIAYLGSLPPEVNYWVAPFPVTGA